ncbi:hypothetical protein Hypma_012210 [Hypsizygus marmoreus]|uniref:DUF2828 domain-containing protein n=1 Tax=Hypsizygus marmoreus TaxID=39966 RepID=A0A369JN13_HYPMA|nr:hypothetical protein Hypma_012210 [Hypsizygus marmoreus]
MSYLRFILRAHKASPALQYSRIQILRCSLSPRMTSTLAIASSSQNVTLPDIPELYDPNFLNVLIPPTDTGRHQTTHAETPATPKNPMIDALQSTSHHTFTENLAPTYDSTLSPTLDAFQCLASYTSADDFNKYLENAWAEDPELTLRIIWNIRSIHDGKGDKETFYKAFGWLYDNHPRTAISNLHLLVEPVCTTPKGKNKQGCSHGYWKDLLNIVALATVDELGVVSRPSRFLHAERMKYKYGRELRQYQKDDGNAAARVQVSLRKAAEEQAAAKEKRIAVGAQRYENLVAKLAQPKYRALYIAVARLFSEALVRDLHILDELDALDPNANRISLLKQLSLAGKWAPTPHGAHDRHTNIATAISLLLRHAQTPSRFPSALDTPLEPQESATILRSFYQRWILTRLRSITLLPEPLMSANRWTDIKYNRVSSVCMKNNTVHFYKHDPDGFEKYLISVESGRKSISGATLFPHELVAQAVNLARDVEPRENGKFPALKEFRKGLALTKLRVVEAQWKTLIEKLRESGYIDNSVAICDVSGSMGSLYPGAKFSKKMKDIEPILPAVSLSLLLAYLAKPPFNSGFITFSAQPKYVQLDLSKPLYETVNTMVSSEWEMNTDFNAVFLKLLLPLAIKNKVAQEDMIKRLFVFSDMQFDACRGTSDDAADWATNHDAIEAAYREAGYEMPQIVYWDLGERGTVEVQSDRKGVALMNGFSPAMLKLFMGEVEEEPWESIEDDGETKKVTAEEEFNPLNVMKKALMKKSFDGLVVVD